MSGDKKPKKHHWWPVALQSYWANSAGDLSWIEPSGKISKKRAANRKIGFKLHGHTIFHGRDWESTFESEFFIDNEIHRIIASLAEYKPFGRTSFELVAPIRCLYRKDRNLREMCRFYSLEEKLHRNLLLLLYSLLIRCPANRSKLEGYATIVGLEPDEEVGKANIMQSYNIAKRLCQNGPISSQFFVLLHSPFQKFIFGDGCLDWLTSGLVTNRINGRTLVPLTPNLCVYFCTPMAKLSSPNCASLSIAPWMVDWVNEITQIYSKDSLYFLGKAPKLTSDFRQAQFLEHKEKTDALIEMLDEAACITERNESGGSDGRCRGMLWVLRRKKWAWRCR